MILIYDIKVSKMDKILLLKWCIYINIIIMVVFMYLLFECNQYQSSYFQVGWSDNFVFVTIKIDTAAKYISLCGFIIIFNVSEIFLNDIAMPLIQFSTYNPYKTLITDFSRCELEFYSNIIYFIITTKRFIQIYVTFTQIDIAIISLLSSQTGVALAIHYLLNKKKFKSDNVYTNIEMPYNTNEFTPIIVNNNAV